MAENDSNIRNRMLLSTQISHSSIIIRKEALDTCGLYNPDYNLMEDHELRLRIGIQYKLHNLQDFTIIYRINPKGVSIQNRKKQHQLALSLCLKYRKYYPNFIKWLIGNILLNLLPSWCINLMNKLNRLNDTPLF